MKAILLIPTPEWSEKLLREGPCGAAPPRAHVDATNHWRAVERGPGIALVLAWNGKVVPEGMDRAARTLAAREELRAPEGVLWYQTSKRRGRRWALSVGAWGGLRRSVGRDYGALTAPSVAATIAPAWSLATVCAARGLGEVVVLE